VAEYVLTFQPDPEEAATSAALGWTAAIPGISGTIVPVDSSTPAKAFTATAQGRAAFTGLPSGSYIVDAARWLTTTEDARLTANDDAVGYAGRWTVQVASGSGSASLETPASRRKGLIISEWAFNHYSYHFGGFLELYNNSDTTIYLDGMVVGEGYNASLDAPITPCSRTAPYRSDPEGIWSRSFARIPGTGREFPVAPGQTIVIATDAIDHRGLYPRTLDLSHADFEFIGPADVDNPTVPNIVDLGPLIHPAGHGNLSFGLVHVPFVALPIDPATLTRSMGSSGTEEFARIPSDRVLDAFALGTNYPAPAGFNDCPPLVHPQFDRRESRARGTDDFTEFEFSVSRRRVPVTNGPAVLQWTRSGNADLIRTSRTPGIPGPP
jgi:hypothetical protein